MMIVDENGQQRKNIWGPAVDVEAVNAAIDRHFPKPAGTCGTLYFWGRDGLWNGEPTWVLGGQTPVHSECVLRMLKEKGEDVSKLLEKGVLV